MKKAIAMKCIQEQWDSIKDRIPEEIKTQIRSFDDNNVLVNNWEGKGIISNCCPKHSRILRSEYFSTFNAKIFLDACGIETDVYEITKEQVLMIAEKTQIIKEWFPEVFKKELEVNKWYKSLEYPKQLIFLVDFKDVQHIKGYGFDTRGNWEKDNNHFSWGLPIDGNFEEATQQEVEVTLISEAKKRGFKKGAVCNNSFVWNDKKYKDGVLGKGYFEFKDNKLNWNSSNCEWYTIFSNGIWATMIQPEKMTLEQIEKELGRKIQIV